MLLCRFNHPHGFSYLPTSNTYVNSGGLTVPAWSGSGNVSFTATGGIQLGSGNSSNAAFTNSLTPVPTWAGGTFRISGPADGPNIFTIIVTNASSGASILNETLSPGFSPWQTGVFVAPGPVIMTVTVSFALFGVSLSSVTMTAVGALPSS